MKGPPLLHPFSLNLLLLFSIVVSLPRSFAQPASSSSFLIIPLIKSTHTHKHTHTTHPHKNIWSSIIFLLLSINCHHHFLFYLSDFVNTNISVIFVLSPLLFIIFFGPLACSVYIAIDDGLSINLISPCFIS